MVEKFILQQSPGASGCELRAVHGSGASYPGRDEILVRVHAVGISYRDVLIADGACGPVIDSLVPLCEGAGVVIDVGKGVTAFRPGDKVMGTVVQDWMDGPKYAWDEDGTLGERRDGVLSRNVKLVQWGALPIPGHLSLLESACLPYSALTAWNALFETPEKLKKGDTLLVHGAEDVAVSACQFAKSVGAKVILATASSTAAARARSELGVDAVVDYSQEWVKQVDELTEGVGVNRALDFGAEGTLQGSIAALSAGGSLVFAGGVPRKVHAAVDLRTFMERGQQLHSVSGGSKASFERMSRFMSRCKLVPVVGKVFDFEDAGSAYDYLRVTSPFGKVVIDV